jgi:L-fucose isomerase-like protein
MAQLNQSPIGLLTIGRKRPGFDQEWNQIMRGKADEALIACGLRVVRPDLPVVDEQTTKAALDLFRDEGCDALLVLQPSLGNGQLSLTVAQNWEAPLVLWATPERWDSTTVSSCSLVAQHLWASVMRQTNHPYEFVYGDPASADTRQALQRAVAMCRTAAALHTTKMGLVGSHAPGFLGMAVDLAVLKKELGVQLQTLSLPMFLDRVRAVPEQQASTDAKKVMDLKLPMGKLTAEDVAMNSRFYLAILDLMAEESLDGVAIQCWPEMANILGQWPYLAFSRLADEGRIVALEGDVDGGLTCLLAQKLGLGTGFITDWLEHDKNSVMFWHPGNAPISMLNAIGSPEGPSLAAHFNIQKPMVVDGPLRTDLPVTVARLWNCDGKYHLMAFEGRIVKPRRKLTGNYATVEVADRNMLDYFETMCHAGVPHHVVLFHGQHSQTLQRLARVLGISWLG